MSQMFYGPIDQNIVVRMVEFKEDSGLKEEDSDLEHELDVQDDQLVPQSFSDNPVR
jgi:hypothetical protein